MKEEDFAQPECGKEKRGFGKIVSEKDCRQDPAAAAGEKKWSCGSSSATPASANGVARAAKKAAAPPPSAAVRWQPPKPLAMSASPPPPSLPAAGHLPGQLHETVCVTPTHGRRQHRFQHISPGGSVRHDEYMSPAGVQQHACEQRLACLHRLAVTRRTETFTMQMGCGTCAACVQFSGVKFSKYVVGGDADVLRDPAYAPSAVKRARKLPCEQW